MRTNGRSTRAYVRETRRNIAIGIAVGVLVAVGHPVLAIALAGGTYYAKKKGVL